METTDPNLQPTSPEPARFKNWPTCKQALTKLPQPIDDTARASVLAGIETSPQRLQIAFEILSWSREAKLPSRLDWLVSPMVDVLGSGDEEPDLASAPVASEAKAWVFRQFREVRNLSDWNRFVASGRHLWVLTAIFNAVGNKHIFIEALTAFGECAEHCQNIDSSGKQKRTAISAEDPKWVARALKSKIPAKLALPKSFFEALFAIQSTAHLADDLRRETNGLQFRLENTLKELAAERAAREDVERGLEQTKETLAETKATLARTEEELREEKLHITRQGGFNEAARNETINQVLSHVRRGVLHKLDNISGFADRPEPNGQMIIELTEEIRTHLAGVEEAMKK